MKTRAQLIRDAKSGEFTFQLVERFGERDFNERSQGKRTIGKVQTNGFYLINQNGEESFLDIPKASLMEYDKDELRVYNPGFREMNDDEKAVMAEWKKIEETDDYQERAKVDLLSDGSSTFYQKKQFFGDRKMLHLMGTQQSGMKLDFFKYSEGEKKCIRDEKAKGDVVLVYKVERKGAK